MKRLRQHTRDISPSVPVISIQEKREIQRKVFTLIRVFLEEAHQSFKETIDTTTFEEILSSLSEKFIMHKFDKIYVLYKKGEATPYLRKVIYNALKKRSLNQSFSINYNTRTISTMDIRGFLLKNSRKGSYSQEELLCSTLDLPIIEDFLMRVISTRLSPREKDAITAIIDNYSCHRFTQKQLADRLGLKLQTFKKYVLVGRRKLRVAMQNAEHLSFHAAFLRKSSNAPPYQI